MVPPRRDSHRVAALPLAVGGTCSVANCLVCLRIRIGQRRETESATRLTVLRTALGVLEVKLALMDGQALQAMIATTLYCLATGHHMLVPVTLLSIATTLCCLATTCSTGNHMLVPITLLSIATTLYCLATSQSHCYRLPPLYQSHCYMYRSQTGHDLTEPRIRRHRLRGCRGF